MTHLDHIINRLAPDDALQIGLELPDRRKMQHVLGLVVALCTVGLQTQVGQAGMGGVHQVQVSHHSPVPLHAVSAQPQMLLLILDQQFNLPRTLQAKQQLLSRAPVSL